MCSPILLEANLLSALSEGLSAEHEVVLSDETLDAVGLAAVTRILAVLSGVSELLVGHLLLFLSTDVSVVVSVCFLDLLFINNYENSPV